jgi:recA bacterial DNA recombination protein
MSSAVVSTSAALGRPFVFDVEAVPVSLPSEPPAHPPSGPAQVRSPQGVRRSGELASTDPRLAHITPASRLDIRPAPEMVSSGVAALDSLTGGLPRGCLTEICGPASSGRTTLLLAALAAATRRGEFCAVVDASDALDPHSAAASGVELDHLLWVRCGDDFPPKSLAKSRIPDGESKQTGTRESCLELVEGVGAPSQAAFDFHNSSRQSWHRLEQVLRATDLLLESGGFGLIILDLGDMPTQASRRIPLTTWFRFRRAIENKPTILLTIEQHPIAGSCSSLLLQLEVLGTQYSVLSANRSLVAQTVDAERGTTQEGQPAHARLLTGLKINAELIRSRLERKPARSITFGTKTAWAG